MALLLNVIQQQGSFACFHISGTVDEYPIYSIYPHVLGSFKSVFSILISVLMHFLLIFVYRSNLEAKEKREEYWS